MLINYLLIVLTGLLFGKLFISLSKKFALRYNILISQGTPLVGGFGMGLSFVLVSLFGFFLYGGLSREIVGIIIASSIMLILGIIDDWRELSISAKFFIQIIATFLLIIFGIKTQIAYIGNLLNVVITFIWVLAITNAFNHLDVIDGVAAGCAMIISCAFFTVALLNGDIKIAILCLALAVASLSCLIHNFPPAKIYMGNSGSHFVGFTLAAIALSISYAPLERKIALLSPLLILGLPIFDTAFLILMRLIKSRSIFKKSNDHLVLRLLRRGYSKKKALLFMIVLSLFFSLSGVILSQASSTTGAIIIVLAGVVSLLVTERIGRVPVND
ncbi:MAG: undecaprenyl/decaprenyl-phosphate alpha-N-acetylglucosaminyl 1-phosphate transferase [Candidatus Omnitrophica bacterium]|nr:undecaprenyl/decaprenyl-phosphate alpha-N-acetylglucosaminyl 1-phosphate transferase [Candidatus Omnitrophota bacterium]